MQGDTPLLKATLHNRQVNGGLSFIMPKLLDLTGKRYNKLTVLGLSYNDKIKRYWECQCDCGNKIIVCTNYLTGNNTGSCGCYRKEVKPHYKHGQSNCRLYRIWRRMKERCFNPKNNSFENYGGRGIKVCDEWLNNFNAFYEWAMDNGYEDSLTIDRIDVNANYEPSNCRWATMKQQQNNKRSNFIIYGNGERKTLKQWCEQYNIARGFIQCRLKKGMSMEDILKQQKPKKKIYEYKGEKLTVQEMSKISGIPLDSIRARIKYGWEIEKIMETPLRKRAKNKKLRQLKR